MNKFFVLFIALIFISSANAEFVAGNFFSGFLPGDFFSGFTPGSFGNGFLPGDFGSGFSSGNSGSPTPTSNVNTGVPLDPQGNSPFNNNPFNNNLPAPIPQPVPVPQPFPTPTPALNKAPQFTSTPITSAVVGTAYQYSVTVADPDNNLPLTLSLEFGPAGMSFQGQTLLWTPLPGQVGQNNVMLRITDSLGASSTQAFTISVSTLGGQTQNSPAPTAFWIPLQNQHIGQGSPDWTVVYPFLAFYCQDTATDTRVVSVVSTSTHYRLAFSPRDLVIQSLDKFFVGAEPVTVTCNGVPATFTLNVDSVGAKPVVEDFSDAQVHIGTFAWPESARAGDSIPITVAFENIGSLKLEHVRLDASIPELGIRAPIVGPFDFSVNKKQTKTLVIDIPDDTPAGMYEIRLTLDSDFVHRIVHRDIEIN